MDTNLNMNLIAPEPILRAAMRVLFVAACTTRNWTLQGDVPIKQINGLWEAIHEIPDLVCRWHKDAEKELLMYLDEYDTQWTSPKLRAIYEQIREQEKFNDR
jgi:hypothetical protein